MRYGVFSHKLKNQGHHITALDLSAGMLEMAQTKAVADHYLCADIESIPLDSQTFDVVFPIYRSNGAKISAKH